MRPLRRMVLDAPLVEHGSVQVLHRIDADYAKQDIINRGFRFIGSNDLLENPDDDLSKSVFDPAVRFNTSRFVYKFMKPR